MALGSVSDDVSLLVRYAGVSLEIWLGLAWKCPEARFRKEGLLFPGQVRAERDVKEVPKINRSHCS